MATLRELLGEAYKEGMSIEDAEKALADKKLGDLSTGEYVSKGKLAEAEKRAKEAEKKLADKMTEEEKAEAERAEREKHYQELEKENNLHRFKEKLSKTITDDATLTAVAEAYASGDTDKAIELQNDYISKRDADTEKKIKDDLMKKNPQPNPNNGGNGGGKLTKDQIMAITDPVERQTKIAENMDLFN